MGIWEVRNILIFAWSKNVICPFFFLSFPFLLLLLLFFIFLFFGPHLTACGTVVPQPGTKPMSLAVEALSPNTLHRQGISSSSFIIFFLISFCM